MDGASDGALQTHEVGKYGDPTASPTAFLQNDVRCADKGAGTMIEPNFSLVWQSMDKISFLHRVGPLPTFR